MDKKTEIIRLNEDGTITDKEGRTTMPKNPVISLFTDKATGVMRITYLMNKRKTELIDMLELWM